MRLIREAFDGLMNSAGIMFRRAAMQLTRYSLPMVISILLSQKVKMQKLERI